MSQIALERQPARRSERGFVSVEFMVATCFSFLLLVMVTNLVLVQYGRGIVRASVDESARAGARFSTDPIASCKKRQSDVVGGLGKLATNVESKCELVNGQIRASASADFPGWLPGVPTFHENSVALSGQEKAPK